MSSYRLFQVKTNLEKYQKPSLPKDSDFYVLGDLHGNAIKLIRFLVETNTVSIESKVYSKLYSAYIKKDYSKFERLLKLLIPLDKKRKVNPNNGRLILIGDTVCDRGRSDYMTMLVLQFMHKYRIPFSIIFSNHDQGLLHIMTMYDKGMKPIKSIVRPCDSFDLFSLKKERIRSFISIYKNIYLKSLRVFEEIELENKTREMLLFSHAPCNPLVLKNLVSLLTKNKKRTSALNTYYNPYKLESYSSRVLISKTMTQFIWNRNLSNYSKDFINVFGHVGEAFKPKRNYQINLDTNLGKRDKYNKLENNVGIMSVMCISGVFKEERELQKSLMSAIGGYLDFLPKTGTIGIFHRHGDDGRRRALELKRRIEDINEMEHPSKYSWLTSLYFNNKIVSDEKGRKIGGGARANPHSFISFFLFGIIYSIPKIKF